MRLDGGGPDTRVVFLCRDGAVARYIAHELHAERPLTGIVVETGREARRRKLNREWARTPWWRIPVFAVDLVALSVYGWLWSRALRRRLDGHAALEGYPGGVPLHHVDDANSPACIEVLEGMRPALLVVLGTSILTPAVLALPTGAALNIHGGLVPAYRNVHSEVWAVLNGDSGCVGTSILHLDDGIDSGAVALQESVVGASGFFDLRWRNVQLSARLARAAVTRFVAGSLPREPQPPGVSGFYRTPGCMQLVRLAFTRVR
jgi:hypothetical protein